MQKCRHPIHRLMGEWMITGGKVNGRGDLVWTCVSMQAGTHRRKIQRHNHSNRSVLSLAWDGPVLVQSALLLQGQEKGKGKGKGEKGKVM